ncbi:MAG: hypothetical protein GKR92_05290 [Gammaproteobacteria bacterium]|nr:MAG: hypothetical protein GKR92_05290 [Gammaproteobacteria bacterium]
MENFMSPGTGLVIILLLVVWFLVWLFLPFAIFGIKRRLDTSNELNARIVKLLESNKTE